MEHAKYIHTHTHKEHIKEIQKMLNFYQFLVFYFVRSSNLRTKLSELSG